MSAEEKQRRLHDAIQGVLDDGEIAIAWTLTVDVAGLDDTRYLAHRAGGGPDGNSRPSAWTALGMLEASSEVARRHVLGATSDHSAPEDEEGS